MRQRQYSDIYQLAVQRGWKLCKKCGEKKPIEEFMDMMGGNAKVYHQSYCTPCLAQYQKNWKAAQKN